METSKPHAVLLSSPGLGHLIPLLQLAQRLVAHHGFRVTLFAITASASLSPAESQLLRSPSATTSELLRVVELPPADISGLVDADAAVFTRVVVAVRETMPRFRAAVLGMKDPPSLMVVDFFGFDAFGVPEFVMPKYVFVPSTARLLALTLYVPTLDAEVSGEYVHRAEPIRVPGCRPVRPEDVVDPMLERGNEQYREYVRMGVGIPKADGILLNTWEALEPATLAALRDEAALARFAKVPVYPVGPLARSTAGDPETTSDEVLSWLDLQPANSVVYVCFGSGGTHSSEQLAELAWGLELSRKRFVWVVRPPVENDPSGSFFTTGRGGEREPSDYLPEGYMSRTRNVGMVVAEWAGQVEILSHRSVGGFMSHCGWNSTVESIANGVPMAAWPMYAEQRLNASMLAEELGIAVRPEVWPTKRVVRREEIEKMVRMVMEDEELRERTKQVMKSGIEALSEGGSSYNSLSQLASAAISFVSKHHNTPPSTTPTGI